MIWSRGDRSDHSRSKPLRIGIGNRIAHFFSILCRIYYRSLSSHEVSSGVEVGARSGSRCESRNAGQGFRGSIRRSFWWGCSRGDRGGGCLCNCAFKYYTVIEGLKIMRKVRRGRRL